MRRVLRGPASAPDGPRHRLLTGKRADAESNEARAPGGDGPRRCFGPGGDLLSRDVCRSTIGAIGLTAVFGMGTGVSRPLWPPGMFVERGERRSVTTAPGSAPTSRRIHRREGGQACRRVSTGRLNALPHLHLRPINVVVFDVPRGSVVLERVSRLDAFSAYPYRS
jgi:hypothetical protein